MQITTQLTDARLWRDYRGGAHIQTCRPSHGATGAESLGYDVILAQHPKTGQWHMVIGDQIGTRPTGTHVRHNAPYATRGEAVAAAATALPELAQADIEAHNRKRQYSDLVVEWTYVDDGWY